MTHAQNIAVTLGWLAGSYKIANAISVKIAAAVGTDIRDSAISGKGLFATRSFTTGDVLVTDFMQKQNTDDPRTRWEQSDSCRYTNHSDKPNAFIRKLGETVELVADETIQPNEEITCNYRDASKTLGKAFFYTYRGKPYGNATSEVSFMQKAAATKPDTFYGLPTFLKQSQTTDDILDRIANARAQTATEVSDGNATAGNYRKGRFNYHGLRISIENPKGSTRSGTAADGTRWSTKMKFDYGYIRGTTGADGDPVDVFIGDDPKSEMVYVINQVNKSGSFDEHKVVLGALDAKQAKQTYLSNYKDGWTGCGSVVGMTMQQFKDWLKGDVTKPAGAVKQADNRTVIAPCDNAVQALINMADTAAWRQVPKQVVTLIKSAADVKKQVQKAMETLPVADPGYGYVYWHPQRNNLWVVLGDGDEQDSHDAWWKALSKISGINKVITEAEVGPHGDHKDEWIQIKKARIFTKNSTINPFTLAGKPFGGPNAVTNSVVGALVGGGLGYGGGRLAEMLLPERHFERGRLSKNLALAGAVLGGTPGLIQGATHMGMNHDAGDPSAYRSWFQPTNAQKVAPNSTAWRKHVLGKMAGADPTPIQAEILKRSSKCAMVGMSGLGNPGMRPINVDAFNNVIWHDPYSPPAVNAAAAGIVSGIQQHYGGASVLTPRHFIKGLAAAGVDAATATVAGGVLGVLGGLKPESQQTLQQMGLWAGLMRGSIGSIFGQ